MTRGGEAPVDRSAPPRAPEAVPFTFPPFVRRTPEAGPPLVAARYPRAPLVQLDLFFPAGGFYEPPGEAGLASLTGSLVDEGTRARSALELAAAVERLGGSMSSLADWDTGVLGLLVLERHLGEALELLSEVATSATFPEEEVERVRRQRLAQIRRRRDQASYLAVEALARAIYGDGVYGRPLVGTPETVARLGRERLLDFHSRRWRLADATLVAVGDIDPDAVAEHARGLLHSAGDRERARPPAAEVRPLPRREVTVHVVDRPGAAQTELRIGHRGVPRSHPEWTALGVLNSILGGKFTSRLNLNLRERHGLTYGASTRFTARLGPGPFYASAAVDTESAGKAVRETLSELERLRQEPVGQGELEETKSYLTNVLPYTVQTIGGLAQRLETLVVFDLPDDHYDGLWERVHAVTRERLLELAGDHLHPERAAVVAAGPAELLVPQLEGLGPVEVTRPGRSATAEPSAR